MEIYVIIVKDFRELKKNRFEMIKIRKTIPRGERIPKFLISK